MTEKKTILWVSQICCLYVLLCVNSSMKSGPSLWELVAELVVLKRHRKLQKLDLLISNLNVFLL